MKQKFLTFIIAFAIWIIFAGKITSDVLIIGIGAGLITTVFFHNMLLRSINHPKGWFNYFRVLLVVIVFIPVFFYEVLVAALKVSRHVIEKKPSFCPGIVKVKTKLTNITAITILANLITLTPGTLTLDFDIAERAYYIHWIDVKTREEAEARKEIIERFERWLEVIFR